jgi:hypothetical protein
MVVGARRDIAVGIVLARVAGGARIAARRPERIDALQLVRRAAGTVEILLVTAGAVEWALPELPKMGVDEAVGVGRATETAVRGEAAAGAAARIWRCLSIAGPDQFILLVVAEVLRLAAGTAAAAILDGGGDAGDVAGVVVAAALIEDLAALAAAAIPTGGLLAGPQVAVIAVLLGRQIAVACAADIGE